MKAVAIVVAAGKGKRTGSRFPKQFLNLAGKPMLAHTLEKFERSSLIDEIVVVVGKSYLKFCSEMIIGRFGFKKSTKIVAGGKERQNSVFNALKALGSDTDVVLIHDGVRPLVKTKRIDQLIKLCQGEGPVIFGLPLGETVKRVEENKVITTLDRSKIWRIQTPQAFPYQTIMEAYIGAQRDRILATDDSFLVERMGVNVKVIEGDEDNIKITTREDLRMAEHLATLRIKKKS